jgi:pilus assembly protein FimV
MPSRSASSGSLLALLSFFSLVSFDAQALSLGAIRVLSSLGEPLRAEVNLIDLTEAQARSLRPSLGKSDAYESMGLDYNPDLETMQFNLQRSPDGRAVLQLNNSRPVTSVFVDIVLEVSWAAGKVTRNFTLLLTPPQTDSATAAAVPVTPVLPLATAATPATAAPPAEPATAASAPSHPLVDKPAVPTVAAPASKKSVRVVRGDTAGQLAMQNLPVQVSLDQMLLAVLRSNPNAFVAGNVNRLKTGAVLSMPTAADATGVAPAQARQIILAQSRDFNAFRQQLGSNAQPAQVAPAGREASGQVQSSVTEKTSAASAADKLTLSKGGLSGTGTTPSPNNVEAKFAQERQAKDTADRLAELSKNIGDLNKLKAPPASSALEPTPTPEAIPPVLALATGALPAVTAADSASPGLRERLSNSPLVLPLGAGLLGLLLAWRWLRSHRHSSAENLAVKAVQVDPVLAHEHVIQAESPSFDEDSLNLARVALHLGRKAEAEALLRDGLKRTPQRLALHLELMAIYIARGDAASFEALAIDASGITNGKGADWTQICQKGQALDPTNPLYQCAVTSLPPAPPFSKLDFDLELGLDAPDKAPPQAKP